MNTGSKPPVQGLKAAFLNRATSCFSRVAGSGVPKPIKTGNSSIRYDSMGENQDFCKEIEDIPNIQSISSKDIGKCIRLHGIVKKVGEVKAQVILLVLNCSNCNEIFNLRIQKEDSMPPSSKCPICYRQTLKQDLDKSKFIDRQEIELTDTNESKTRIKCIVRGPLANKVSIGEKIVIIGNVILTNTEQNKNKEKHVYSLKRIDVLSLEKVV